MNRPNQLPDRFITNSFILQYGLACHHLSYLLRSEVIYFKWLKQKTKIKRAIFQGCEHVLIYCRVVATHAFLQSH